MTTKVTNSLINETYSNSVGDNTMTGALTINKAGAGVIVQTTDDAHTFTGHHVEWINGNLALSLTKAFSTDTATISNRDNAGAVLGGLIFDSTGDIRTLESAPPMANDLSMVHKKHVDDNFVSLFAAGKQTLIGDLEIADPNPQFLLTETDAAVNNQKWAFSAIAEELFLQCRTDADAGGGNLIKWTRTSNQIDTMEMVAAGVSWAVLDNNNKKITVTEQPVGADELTRKDYIDDNFVADAGGTMSGELIVDYANPFITMQPDTAFENTTFRFKNSAGTTTFEMEQFNGLTVNLQNGSANVGLLTSGNVTVSATEPTGTSHLTRKDYVDNVINASNAIINGNFDVWQRSTNLTSIASDAMAADRFIYNKAGSTTAVHTLARSTDTPTTAESGTRSNYALLLDVTTADATIGAGDYVIMSYRMEGYDYARLAGGDGTLSFWVKAAKTGIHCVAFRNSGVDRSYLAEYTIAAANTWEKHTVTVPLTETAGTWNYLSGRGLEITFTLAAGTTFQTTAGTWQTGNFIGTSGQVNELDSTANNFRIAQVQFEKGSYANKFEFKNYNTELTKCQRYFQKSYNDNVDPGTVVNDGCANTREQGSYTHRVHFQTMLAVTMRATPSTTWYSPVTGTADRVRNDNAGSDVTISSTANEGANSTGYPIATSNSTSGNRYIAHYTVDAEL